MRRESSAAVARMGCIRYQRVRLVYGYALIDGNNLKRMGHAVGGFAIVVGDEESARSRIQGDAAELLF